MLSRRPFMQIIFVSAFLVAETAFAQSASDDLQIGPEAIERTCDWPPPPMICPPPQPNGPQFVAGSYERYLEDLQVFLQTVRGVEGSEEFYPDNYLSNLEDYEDDLEQYLQQFGGAEM